MRAIVYKSTGSWYSIKTETGNMMNALHWVFKIDNITSNANSLAVGDEVEADSKTKRRILQPSLG